MNVYAVILSFSICFLGSCAQDKSTNKVLDNHCAFDASLHKGINDSVSIKQSNPRERYRKYFVDVNGYCILSRDTIRIFNASGVMQTKQLEIIVENGKYSFGLTADGCTYHDKYIPVNQHLTINKKHFAVNDTIVGEMYFKGICILDSAKSLLDTVEIAGKFSFRVRDEKYNYSTLYQERAYSEFLKLAKSRPDTVVNLSLTACGLKAIPRELFLFRNIKSLNLDDNDLSDADLSTIRGFKSLKSISLRACSLKYVPSSIFYLANLEELDLYDNDIRELPIGLFNLKKLRFLQAGNNHLIKLPNEILNMKRLEMLEISGNNVKKLPENFFKKLSRLKEFYPSESMNAYEYKDFKADIPDS